MSRPAKRPGQAFAGKCSGTAGFTLIEALVSVGLLGLIVGALATVTAQWLPNWNRGLQRVQQQETLALGLERLVADISAAEYVTLADEKSPPVFRGNEHAVIFVRRVLGPNFALGLELVRISEIGTPHGPAMVRTRAAFAAAGADAESPNFSNPVVLVRAPFRVVFAYSDASGAWRTQWLNAARLPQAVRLRVIDAGTGSTLPVSTVASIRVQAPAACLATLAIDCFRDGPAPSADSNAPPPPPAPGGEKSL